MWQVKTEILQKDKLIKYSISQESKAITQIEFLDYLTNSKPFRSFYNQIIKDNPFKGFFWENPPFSISTSKQIYEFVLIKSQFLEQLITPDTESFKEYFNPQKQIVTFKNLGKDATLIVPSPQSELSNYTHLGQFIRYAPTDQIDAFWKNIGITVKAELEEKKVWLNTEGTGVYWLHARLDSYPKYYKFNPYRN